MGVSAGLGLALAPFLRLAVGLGLTPLVLMHRPFRRLGLAALGFLLMLVLLLLALVLGRGIGKVISSWAVNASINRELSTLNRIFALSCPKIPIKPHSLP